MGNKQLKSILPGSKPSTLAAASFFASLGQFTFRSKAQKSKDQTIASEYTLLKRLDCQTTEISYWSNWGIVSRAWNHQERFTLVGWRQIREQTMAKITCADDHRIMGLSGRRPTAKIKISIHSALPQRKCKLGRSLDVEKLHNESFSSSARTIKRSGNKLFQGQLLTGKWLFTLVFHPTVYKKAG